MKAHSNVIQIFIYSLAFSLLITWLILYIKNEGIKILGANPDEAVTIFIAVLTGIFGISATIITLSTKE